LPAVDDQIKFGCSRNYSVMASTPCTLWDVEMNYGNADLRGENVQTPCLVVDRSKIMANIRQSRRRIAGRGIEFRPHLKTVKSYDAAILAMDSPQGPAAVSTLREAEEFGRNGVTDLLYAVGIAPQKLARVTAIRQSGVDLKIIVDSIGAARAVAEHARSTSDRIPTLIEIDVDGHRAGIPLNEQAELIEVGRAVSRAAELRGVMTHAGGSYGASSPDALASAAEGERSGVLTMANALRGAQLTCPVVSVGSTPTLFAPRSTEGITEIRAGVFMFFDLCQAGLGVCRIEDIAVSVVATVIGHQRSRNWIITDAGWTALSSDRSTSTQSVDQLFGVVCDLHGQPYEDLVVLKVNQEHGVLAPRPGSSAAAPNLPIGARVRILPNHACATASQHYEYKVIDGGTTIVDVWPRFGGW
jgi:D-serine deaminase-like pyridoxal phosphate-dependent protein